ncbi:hypothetical protein [Bacteriovorax sp. Seq25_V]|uniref:hypothetical protein n=1 Tax=Bacteriovorax sp. Seq25_V TaxID=1201288 RepID=UPI000389F4CF|nr:hypothetical protein [Bacteriovorax sp. Seq25_V]EQC44737.1 hypothetical protein M900_0353 [Bacteriovorax sp. Seq25_V]
MKNLIRLSLLGYLLSWSVLAKTGIPVNMHGTEKYFTPLEMKQALTWKIYFSGDKKDGASKVLPMKLYETKDLNGKIIGEISENGFFFKGKKLCHFEKVHGGLSLLIDEKPLRDGDWDVVKSFGMETKHLCESYPLRRDLESSYDLEKSEYQLEVHVTDGKVGTYDHEGTPYYFKIDHMVKEASRIEKDTETILKENLSDEEMKALNKSLVELRGFLKTATLEQLYEKVLNGRDGNNVLIHKNIFNTNNKSEFFKLVKSRGDFINDVFKVTFLKFCKLPRKRVGTTLKGNRTFFVESDSVYMGMQLFEGRWNVSQLATLK